MARGDVEKAQLIRTGLVVSGGGLDGIAGITQIDKVDAFDDAALFHIEAGYDANFQHQF